MFNSRSIKHSKVLSSLFREKKKLKVDENCNSTMKDSKFISLATEKQIYEDLGEDIARNYLCAPIHETQKLLKMKRKRSKHVRKKKKRKHLSVRSHLKYDIVGQSTFSKNSPSKRDKSFIQYSKFHDLASTSLFPDPCKDIRSLQFTRMFNQNSKRYKKYLTPSSSDDDEYEDGYDRGISLSSRSSTLKRQKKKRFHSHKLIKTQGQQCFPPTSYSSTSSLEEQEYVIEKNISIPLSYKFPSDSDRHKDLSPACSEIQSIEKYSVSTKNEISFLTEKVSTARHPNHSPDDSYVASSTSHLEEIIHLKDSSDFTQVSSNWKDENIPPRQHELASKCCDNEIDCKSDVPILDKQNPLSSLPSIDEVVAPGPLFDAYNFDYSELVASENIPDNLEVDPDNTKCIFDQDSEIISEPNDDSSLQRQIEPRITILSSDNDLKRNPEKRSYFHKWSSDIDELVLVQQSNNFHPEIFGYLPGPADNQQLLLIPWTQIENFKYKCNANPCIEIIDDNK